MPRRRRTRLTGEAGTSALEFALLAPFLFTVLFGIIEFGALFNDYNSVRQGTRDVARDAVVGAFGTTDCTDLVGVTGAGASSAESRRLLCSAKSAVGINDRSLVRVKLRLAPSGYAEKEAMVMCVQYAPTSLTGLFAPVIDGRHLKSKVQMRIEKVVAPGLLEVQEAPPTGGSWSWCTLSA